MIALLKVQFCCRRVVQIDITSSEVHIEMSQYVKRELHSLFNYLQSSLADEELASTISRHFTKRVSCQKSNASSHGLRQKHAQRQHCVSEAVSNR